MSSSMIFGVLMVSLAVALAMPATEEKPVPTLPGACPDVKAMANMEGLKLDGEWTLVSGAKNGFEKKGTIKCVKKSVTTKPDGSFDTVMSAIKDGQPKSKNIRATPITGQPGKFTLHKDPADKEETGMTKTGTLVYADANVLLDVVCGTDGSKHGYMISLFSKQPTADAASKEKAMAALKSSNLPDELKPIEGC